MRDIRDDLADRLRELGDERRRLAATLKALEMQEVAVKALLDAENRQFGVPTASLGQIGTSGNVPDLKSSRRFVLECLGDGQESSVSRMRRQASQLETFSNENGGSAWS